MKTEQTNARGQKTEYTYDALGRIVVMTNAEDTRSYTYDANGNILTVTDKNGVITRVYDALNRVIKYTDTEGNTIRYSYDGVGNLTRMIYPDGTAVVYAYDVNNNLVTVTDWEGRATTYTYDENNKVVSVAKPDGSITETVYDDAQRVVSTVERASDGSVISGFEYTYDKLSRIITEKSLANGEKICYNYDEGSRVVKKCICDSHSNECGCEGDCYSYDKAGNITGARIDCTSHTSTYDTNNRLTAADGVASTYDADGNMLTAATGYGTVSLTYDSANRLISAGGNTYTYNAEDVRIRNLCGGDETKYVYDTNARLSRLLVREKNGVITKYIYGRGLIGEESGGVYRTYHFDYRGSTVAITDICGNITDTFAYDTYGRLNSRTGTTDTPFMYNGRDGVVTDANGLLYMRARYYSPNLMRFVNADIVAGDISNAITLNRYAYANGNPVSNVDPFGLSADVRGNSEAEASAGQDFMDIMGFDVEELISGIEGITMADVSTSLLINEDALGAVYDVFKDIDKTSKRPKGMGKREWARLVNDANKQLDDLYGPASKLAKGLKALPYITVGIDAFFGAVENYQNGEEGQEIVTDIIVDVAFGATTTFLSSVAAGAAAGAVAGSVAPGVGNLIGMGVGILTGAVTYVVTEVVEINDKSLVELAGEGIDLLVNKIGSWFD